MSFHGRGTTPLTTPSELRRPKTLPELFSTGQSKNIGHVAASVKPRLTKLLLNVTVQGSLGALQIIISPESTVSDLIDAAIRLYVKEARRPFLPESEPSRFDLHYSQFSLESIGRDEKLISLGSRNFFLCGRKVTGGFIGGDGSSSESCSKEVEKVAKTGIEIKPGKPLKVEPEDGYTIHASQVTIEKVKEDEYVSIYVKNGEDKSEFLLATLSQKVPQLTLDLYFEQEFEVTHNSKSSVFILGYKVPDVPDEQDEEMDSDSDIEEFMRQQAGPLPPNGMNEAAEDDSGSDDGDESRSDEGEDEDESDDDEEEEDEAPLKVAPPSKKKPNGEAMNNTVASKKAIQNKSSGGKKKCPFPCGPSCKN